MTQHWDNPADAGALRFISRQTFRQTSFPQAACQGCAYQTACAELLTHDLEPGSTWLVRGSYAASSDGHPIERCARRWSEATQPVDVTLLRQRLTIVLRADYGPVSGPPPPRPREARSSARASAPIRTR